jgi:hypothetical protein
MNPEFIDDLAVAAILVAVAIAMATAHRAA